MKFATYFRPALLLAGLAAGLTAAAQHPAANLLNWRTVHPEKAADGVFSAFRLPMYAPNDSVLFIRGGAYGGRLLRTTDRGLNWQTPSPTPPPPGGLAFFSAQEGLVSYDSSASLPLRRRGQLRFTTDGATTWGPPRAAPSGETRFLSASEGLVFQRLLPGGLVVYRTTNAGLTWSVLDSLTGLPAWGLISVPSPNTAYLFSGDSVRREVIQLALGRNRWRVRSLPAATGLLFNGGIRQIHFNSDSVGQAHDESDWEQRIFTTTNGGRTWTKMPSPQMTGGINNVFALVDNQRVLFHDEFPTQHSDLMRTANGGQAWQAVPMADYTAAPDGPGDWNGQGGSYSSFAYCPYTNLLGRPSGVSWATGADGRIYYSTDFGATWTLRSRVLLAARPVGMDFPDPTHGWVASDMDGLMRTTDSGETWTRVTHPGLAPYAYIGATAFPDADTLFLATAQNSTPNVKLYRSTNGGQTWTTPTVPVAGYLQAIRFVDGARRGVAVGAGGAIVRTTDGGQSWQSVASGTTDNLTGVTWASGQKVLVAGGHSLLQSTNGGATWQSLTTLPRALMVDEYLHSVVFPSNRLGFISTTQRNIAGNQYDTLYRTTNGGQSWRVVPGMRGGTLSFASPRDGLGSGQATQDSGRTWTYYPYTSPTYWGLGVSPIAVDADNCFLLSGLTGSAGAKITRYSKRFLRAAPLPQTTLTTGTTLPVAFTTEGAFTPAERDFRVELSNIMGRFRRGQTITIGRGAASPITATLPANLPPGTRYRLRVVRADSSLLGADTGQNLTIQRPTGTAPDAAVLPAPHLYPNPAQHTVTVSFAEGARAGRQVRLLDLTGRVVLLTPAEGAETRVSLAGVGAGCYLLQVRTPSGGQHTQRLIVQP